LADHLARLLAGAVAETNSCSHRSPSGLGDVTSVRTAHCTNLSAVANSDCLK